MNKRILAAFTAIAVAASTLTILSFANDDSVKDGVPVLSGTFEKSDYYPSTNEPPLGIANVFHLFAFDNIDLNAHCNGNFAAPDVDASKAANGTNQNGESMGNTGTYPEVEGEVSLATVKLSIANTTKVDKLLVPKDHVIIDTDGYTIDKSEKKPVDENGNVTGQIKIGENIESAHLVDMQGSSVAFIEKSYVDFAAYQKAYGDLSAKLAKPYTGSNISYPKLDVAEEGHRATVNLEKGKINILNMNAEDFAKYDHGFDIENVIFEDNKYPGTQSLIINVDMANVTTTEKLNGKEVKTYSTIPQIVIHHNDGTIINNAETNVYYGTIVLWNIYDSSESDGCYHGIYTYGNTSLGSVLAPYAKINANQNVDGNIIANSIYTGAESHRCDFMGPLPVSLQKPGTTPSEPDEGDNEPEVTTPVSTPDSEGDNEPEVTTPASTPDPEGDNEPEVTTPASTPDSEGDNEPEVTTPASSPEPEVSTSPSTADSGVAPDDDDNNTTTPVTDPAVTTTPDDGVADDGDDNAKTTTTPAETTTTTSHDEGVADGGDGNDKDTGTGSDGDENNRPPKTGDSAPAALAVALIGSAIVITALKKNKDK